jgi:hypothetical protein
MINCGFQLPIKKKLKRISSFNFKVGTVFKNASVL